MEITLTLLTRRFTMRSYLLLLCLLTTTLLMATQSFAGGVFGHTTTCGYDQNGQWVCVDNG